MIKYRIDQNAGVLPSEGIPVIQAIDKIATRGVFTVFIRHLLVASKTKIGGMPRVVCGFMPIIKAGGITCDEGKFILGDSAQSYDFATDIALTMLDRKLRQAQGFAVKVT